MKTWSGYLAVALLALLLGAIALLVNQRAEIETWKGRALLAETEAAQRRSEQAALTKTIREEQDRAVALQNERTPVPASGAQPPPAAAEALGQAFGAGLDEAIKADIAKWLADANDPAVMRRLNTQARNQTLRRYSSLFTQLNLPAEQTEALTKLLTDKRQAPMDIAVASLQGGTDPAADVDAYRGQIVASRAQIEAQVQALLGDAGYAQYQAYDRNFGQTNVLNNLQTALLATHEPLTAEQAAQMTQLMQANNTTRVTAPVVDGARAFLSPTQVQALQDLRAIQQANAQKRLQSSQILPTAPAEPGKK